MKNNETPQVHTAGPWFISQKCPVASNNAGRREFYIFTEKGNIATIPTDLASHINHQARANARFIAAAPLVREKSQDLYNAIMAYLMDIPDSELPEDLVAAFDAIEAAWHLADGTKPER